MATMPPTKKSPVKPKGKETKATKSPKPSTKPKAPVKGKLAKMKTAKGKKY